MGNRARLLVGGIAATVALGAMLMIVCPPFVVSDSALGFAVGRSMAQGSPVNERFVVDPADISQDLTRFLAWWSPGQYVVPTALETLGFDLGGAILVTTLIFRALALVGLYLLYRRLEFSIETSLLAVLLTALHIRFLLAYLMYHGGGLLMMGFLPWCVLGCLAVRELRVVHLPLLFGMVLVGTFLKLSFLIAALALVLSLVLARRHRGSFEWWVYAAKAATVLLSSFGLVWLTYLRGAAASHPMNLGDVSLPMRDLLFATAAPLFTLFSSGDLVAHGLELGNAWTHGNITPLLALGTALSAYIVYRIVRSDLGHTYRSFVVGFCVAYVGSFIALAALDANVSFNYRHLAPCGLLVLPGLLELLRTWPSALVRRAVTSMLAVAVVGATAVLVGAFFVLDRTESPQGITHLETSGAVLDLLHEIDETPLGRNVLVVIPDPSLALEIRRHRTLNEGTRYWTLGQLRTVAYRGRVDDLFVVMATDQPAERKQAILEAFVDYPADGWMTVLEREWTVLHQTRPEAP